MLGFSEPGAASGPASMAIETISPASESAAADASLVSAVFFFHPATAPSAHDSTSDKVAAWAKDFEPDDMGTRY